MKCGIYKGILLSFEKRITLTHATIQMNLQALCQVKPVSHKKTNTVRFHLDGILNIVKTIKTQSRLVVVRSHAAKGRG